MVACRAFLWRLFAFEYVSAHEAFPLDGMIAFPYGAFLYLFEICLETLAVMLFDSGDRFEMFGYFVESLLACHGC